MALDQLLVEGFLVKPLKALVEAGGRKLESSGASLRVMPELLVVKGLSEPDAQVIVAPTDRNLTFHTYDQATAQALWTAPRSALTSSAQLRTSWTTCGCPTH